MKMFAGLTIDASLGKVVSDQQLSDARHLCLAIFPALDLAIDQPTEFTLRIAKRSALETENVPQIQVIVRPQHRLSFPPALLREPNNNKSLREEGCSEMSLPWMHRANYAPAIWFFAVRLTLKKPELEPWRASVLLPTELWSVPTQLQPVYSHADHNKIMFTCGVGRSRGRRAYMEDMDFAYDCIGVHDHRKVAVYGVLDGHGGQECAQFAADDIPMKIVTNLKRNEAHVNALYQSFLSCDEEYLQSGSSAGGSTANIILYDYNYDAFFIANTGDTRAVLCREKKAINLSQDRKATDPEEVARIAMSGGYVVNGRVLGTLAVSRALGDGQLKQPNKGILICDPEISFLKPCEQDKFIIIATDGLWDVITSQQAVSFIFAAIEKEGLADSFTRASKEAIRNTIEKAAVELAQYVVEKLGSGDNVTVLVIALLDAVTTEKVEEVHETIALGPGRVTNKICTIFEIVEASNNAHAKSITTLSVSGSRTGLERNSSKASIRPLAETNSSSESKRELVPTAKAGTAGEEEDELMRFLEDDGNFAS